jgi:LPS O-antigen subunit length determinant protein (WzzB/FepE family)
MVILKYALAVVLGALIGGLVGYHGSCTGSA